MLVRRKISDQCHPDILLLRSARSLIDQRQLLVDSIFMLAQDGHMRQGLCLAGMDESARGWHPAAGKTNKINQTILLEMVFMLPLFGPIV